MNTDNRKEHHWHCISLSNDALDLNLGVAEIDEQANTVARGL